MDTELLSVSDNLAINFLNTQYISRGKKLDLLQNNDDFNEWLSLQKRIVSDDTALSIKTLLNEKIDIAELKSFRDDLHVRINESIESGRDIEYWEKFVNHELSAQALYFQMDGEYAELIPTQHGIDALKAIIYVQLAKLIQNKQILKLEHCANPNCILIFVNKSGKRKWCSMKICGNRNKVAQHIKRES